MKRKTGEGERGRDRENLSLSLRIGSVLGVHLQYLVILFAALSSPLLPACTESRDESEVKAEHLLRSFLNMLTALCSYVAFLNSPVYTGVFKCPPFPKKLSPQFFLPGFLPVVCLNHNIFPQGAYTLFTCLTVFLGMPIAFLARVSSKLNDIKTSPCISLSGSPQTVQNIKTQFFENKIHSALSGTRDQGLTLVMQAVVFKTITKLGREWGKDK